MTQEITGPGASSASERTTTVTRALLACGVAAGPLFIVVDLFQMAARAGFDPARHPISLLSTGELGWIQITNFVVAGLLFVAAAVGMRRVLQGDRGGTWGPRLIGAMGLALIWGGVMVADPADGFPPGTPPGRPDQLSWHGTLHTIGPVVGYLAPLVACFVFARRFGGLGRRGWAAYCTATGVVAPLIAVAAFPTGDFRLLFAGGVLLWGWASVLAAHLLTASRRNRIDPVRSASGDESDRHRQQTEAEGDQRSTATELGA
jgi:hypothetical protein